MGLPRLITPQGATILLTPELYQTILHVVAVDHPRPEPSREERLAFVRATFGKYCGTPSLTQALLDERAAARAREEARIGR